MDSKEALFNNPSSDSENERKAWEPDVFKNPGKVPLDKLDIEVSKYERVPESSVKWDQPPSEADYKKFYEKYTKVVPALDPSWISVDKPFEPYQEYYIGLSSKDNSSFAEKNLQCAVSLDGLLTCSYHRFWCYILYHPNAWKVIKDFLMMGVRWYEYDNLEGENLKAFNMVHMQVLKIYERLFKFKESETEYMSEETVMKLLIDSGFLNTPIIIALCCLYSQKNAAFIRHIASLYYSKPTELEKFLDSTLSVLDTIRGYLCGFEPNQIKVPLLIKPKPAIFDPSWYEEVVSYLLETFASLNSFFPFVNQAVELCFKIGFPRRLMYFCDLSFVQIYTDLKDRVQLKELPQLHNLILKNLMLARTQSVEIVRLFSSTCLNKIAEAKSDSEKQKHTEVYLELMEDMLERNWFLLDYAFKYPVQKEVDLLHSYNPDVDKTRTTYYAAVAQCVVLKARKRRGENLYKLSPGPQKPIKEFSMALPEPPQVVQYQDEAAAVIESGDMRSEKEVEQKIQIVLDTFPHLGDGFVSKCLEHYNFDECHLINDILEDNLPPHLRELPSDTIRIPDEPEPEKPVEYKGKKSTHADAMALLNDKSELATIKELIIHTSINDPYDDEYDDRDDIPEAVNGYTIPDKEDDDAIYRHMKDPVVNNNIVSDPSDSSEEEEEEEASTSRGKGAFCEDPAVIRARREAQRRRGGKGGGGGKSGDVVGKPKGQGQDKNVQISRDKKNTNKSSRANHNRKGGAQWKRSRGMIPQ